MTILNLSLSPVELNVLTDSLAYSTQGSSLTVKANTTKFTVLQHLNAVLASAGSQFTFDRFDKWLKVAPLQSIEDVAQHAPAILSAIVALKREELGADTLTESAEFFIVGGYSARQNKVVVWSWMTDDGIEALHGWAKAPTVLIPPLSNPPGGKLPPLDLLLKAAELQIKEHGNTLGGELHHVKVSKKGVTCTVARRMPNHTQAWGDISANRDDLFDTAERIATAF
jgi:hypothetical protein